MTTKTKKVTPDIIPQVAAIETASDKILAVIDKASTDPRCNIEKMRALLDMKMELVRDERRMAYSQCMRAAQAEMKPVVRKVENTHTRSLYAKLEHIDNAIRPIYTEHGFSLSFDSRKEQDSTLTVLCDVLHVSGHTETKELNGALDITGAKGTANKTSIQGVGSTLSYLKRQLTCMVFNVTLKNQDDDGMGEGTDGKQDRFAERVNKDSKQGEIIDNKPVTLEQSAAALLQRIEDAPTVERKGEILMKNVKILAALEEAGLVQLSENIRKKAEEVANA